MDRNAKTARPSATQWTTAMRGGVAAVSVILVCLLAATLSEKQESIVDDDVVVVVKGRSPSPPAVKRAPRTEFVEESSFASAAPVGSPSIVVTAQELERRVRAEPRDAVWAGQAESALRMTIMRSDLRALPVVVRCASTLCEISGSIPVDVGVAAQNAAMLALQSNATTATIGEAGLGEIESGAIESDPANPRRVLFRRYLRRR